MNREGLSFLVYILLALILMVLGLFLYGAVWNDSVGSVNDDSSYSDSQPVLLPDQSSSGPSVQNIPIPDSPNQQRIRTLFGEPPALLGAYHSLESSSYDSNNRVFSYGVKYYACESDKHYFTLYVDADGNPFLYQQTSEDQSLCDEEISENLAFDLDDAEVL